MLYHNGCRSCTCSVLSFGDIINSEVVSYDVLLGSDIGYDCSLHAAIALTIESFWYDHSQASKTSSGCPDMMNNTQDKHMNDEEEEKKVKKEEA